MPTDTTTATETAAPKGTPAADGNPLYLVDGSGFIFRAYHALPPLSRPDGTPVNAVLGFSNMLLKLLADLKAQAVAVVFDSKRENFRSEIYADYKAHRPEPPEDLRPQFALIREAVDAFNLPCLELEGYEADDLIATYARQARALGRPVTIVSSDKDLMQLVGDGIRMLDPMKNKYIGPDEVFEKFGVTPDKVVDVQALAGDSVDNVPGVPGIGVKTAAQLITEYGSLEALLERAGEIKQAGRREKLQTNAELARISKKLVQLEENAPVPTPVEELVVREPDHRKLVEWLKLQGFRSIVHKVEAELAKDGALADGAAPTPAGAPAPDRTDAVRAAFNARNFTPAAPRADGVPVPSPDSTEYELVQTVEQLQAWVDKAMEAGIVAVDTETDSLHAMRAKLVGLSLSVEPGKACYVPVAHKKPDAGPSGGLDFGGDGGLLPGQIPLADVVRVLSPMLAHPGVLKVGHNIKYDLTVFNRHGMAVAPVDDTMLMSYVLEGGAHGHGLKELGQLYCGHTSITYDDVTGTGRNRISFDKVPLDKACAYAAEDADVTLRLYRYLKPRLVRERQVTLYETIERPLPAIIARMEQEGVLVDRAVLRDMSRDFAERLVHIEADVHKLANRSFNVGSPKQLGEILFDELKLPGGKKSSKTGAYSTDVTVLEALAEQGHPIAQRVLDWRQLTKLKVTYTDALAEEINPETGRVHTHFALAATNTGRLSSSDPNVQNIPIRTEEGRKIRAAFVAPEGHKLLSVDYSQIELRLVADMAGIDALKEAFQNGIDVHAATAAQVFGVPVDKVDSDLRRKAKTINFGIIYGISGFGLSQRLGIPQVEATLYIKKYLERFWQLGQYMEQTKEFARQHGFVCTQFGRRCTIQGIRDGKGPQRAFAERQAINAPIQGTAADIIKRAMIRLPDALAAAKLDAKMLLQVHDELLFEVPDAQVEETAALVKRVMEGAATLGVPLEAEAGWGHSWAAAH
ncbi:DNA polymerase I [Aerophototrophica crusticola]|uniref:DNA polymerase I n=1 Tax=Aerophototrophica crusticola TaxID=1709002 RepID=A0A858RB95_9PROT|nr:DNA polymerase I [Rhodospirillaceae bacterium B3]